MGPKANSAPINRLNPLNPPLPATGLSAVRVAKWSEIDFDCMPNRTHALAQSALLFSRAIRSVPVYPFYPFCYHS